MPYDRPTLEELTDQLIADIDSRLEGTDPRLRRSFLGVLSQSLSGARTMKCTAILSG